MTSQWLWECGWWKNLHYLLLSQGLMFDIYWAIVATVKLIGGSKGLDSNYRQEFFCSIMLFPPLPVLFIPLFFNMFLYSVLSLRFFTADFEILKFEFSLWKFSSWDCSQSWNTYLYTCSLLPYIASSSSSAFMSPCSSYALLSILFFFFFSLIWELSALLCLSCICLLLQHQFLALFHSFLKFYPGDFCL